ncbi:bile acid:sodium symporter family protein [Candidatus Latescibacterota bacterium]
MADYSQKTNKIYPILLGFGIFAFITTIIYFAVGGGKHAGIPFVLTFISMALYSKGSTKLKGTAFTFWVFAFLTSAMYFPWMFTNWGFNTKVIVIPMLQLIMFGMGTKLSIGDFVKEFSRPKGIIIGTVMVFTIMPVLGVLVAKLFNFPPEIAVGVILIGSCPGGAASNVMAFLARGNVALSVSVTTLATLLTPIVTPALMKLFAGALLEVSFLKMMMSSFNLIIVPISAGLICNKILYGKADWLKKPAPVAGIGVLAFALTAVTVPAAFPAQVAVLKPGLILGLSLTGIVSVAKVIVQAAHGPDDWMSKILPRVSMLSILLFVTIVVALNRDKLLVVGLMLVAASALHNLLGYIIGYWGSRAIGLSKRDSRTLSIEVALKNGGLGMGLAIEALGSQNAALAPIVFGKWMNISGSALANYWRQRPTGDEPETL